MTDAARLSLLQSLTARLAKLRDEASVAKLVLGEGLSELGGDSGSLCLLTPAGDALEIVAESGYPIDVNEAFARFPIDAPLPASDAFRTRQPVLLETAEERDERYPVFKSAPVVGDESVAVVPLLTDDDDDPCLGALVIGFRSRRSFDDDDRQFLEAIAAQCATAIARSRLYAAMEAARQAAEQANERLRFLADASTALVSDLDLTSILNRITRLAAPRVADWCAIFLAGERQAVEVGAVWHSDPDRLAQAEALVARFPPDLTVGRGVGAVLRTGIEDATWDVTQEDPGAGTRNPDHAQAIQDLGLGAMLTLPLYARGQTIGVLALINDRGRAMTDDDLTLGRELATRAASAIDNARLFTERTQIARSLQAALLPPALPSIPGIAVAATYSAAGRGIDAGGDFYDAFPAGDGRWVLAIGDVCGKGPEAASITGLVRHTIRAVAIGEQSPAAILSNVHAVLLTEMPINAALEPQFCTAVVIVLDPTTRPDATAVVACAGHPLPLVRRADGTTEPVGAAGTALGLPAPSDAVDRTVTLAAGDALVLFTDGITERHDTKQFFGVEGIAAVLARSGLAPKSVIEALEQAAHSFVDAEPHDDMAALVVGVPTTFHAALGLDAQPQSAREARRFVMTTLADWGLDDLADDAALATSELVTNAALHAGTDIELRLFAVGERVRIEVHDGGRGSLDTRMFLSAPEEPDGMTGRGLHVVAALADRIGVVAERAGTTAWFELALGQEATSPATMSGAPFEPDLVASGLTAVTLYDVPVRLMLASELHLAGLVREAQLTAGDGAGKPAVQVRTILESYGGPRTAGLLAARAAAARGDARVTIENYVPVAVVEEGHRFLKLLEMTDAMAREGALLSLPAPPDVRAFRVWCIDEAISQARGEPPTPCPFDA